MMSIRKPLSQLGRLLLLRRSVLNGTSGSMDLHVMHGSWSVLGLLPEALVFCVPCDDAADNRRCRGLSTCAENLQERQAVCRAVTIDAI